LSALVGALILPGGAASANHEATLKIQVGAYLNSAPAETMRFYPGELNVHQGDTLNFYGEFHTATMIPSSYATPAEWKAAKATNPGDEWHGIVDNPDNVAIPWKLLGDNLFSPRADCGSAEDPCEYTGSTELDSGLLLSYLQFTDPDQPPANPGFSVTIDAAAGTSFWVVCRIHPNMTMKVNVVDDAAASHSQEEIDAAKAASIDTDDSAAGALHEQLQTMKESTRLPNGKREWKAYAGYDTANFALFDLYPSRLKLRKGDKVRYEFAQLYHESHTATHPTSHVLENPFEAPLCDPNGDDESGGETLANFNGPFPSCSEGQAFELALPAANFTESGDGVVTGLSDLENSGVGGQLGGSPGRGMDPYVLSFTKPSKKLYRFVCYIHPDMRNAVKVKKVR
jgi:plastocyanin